MPYFKDWSSLTRKLAVGGLVLLCIAPNILAEVIWPRIFDTYGQREDSMNGTFGLLLIMEVFRSEMDHARSAGGSALIAKLKEAGHYPCSDMDREPVA